MYTQERPRKTIIDIQSKKKKKKKKNRIPRKAASHQLGKSHRTWLLNKFILFLAVLSCKSDKNERQGFYEYRNFIESIYIFSYDA